VRLLFVGDTERWDLCEQFPSLAESERRYLKRNAQKFRTRFLTDRWSSVIRKHAMKNAGRAAEKRST